MSGPLAAVLAAAALVAAPAQAPAAELPVDEEAIVVASDAGALSANRSDLRDATAGLDVVRELPQIGAVSVDLPAGRTVGELRRDLAADTGVAVEPNRVLELRLTPSDPAYAASDPNAPGADSYQWHLRKSGFERAWSRSTGERAKVAVIDTGADAGHPDLGPRIEAAFDKDDTLLHGGPEVDENGHGSHVAGLACGQSGDRYGVASAGFACDLTIYKTDLSVASISESIVEATDRDVDVINMSFGGNGTSKALRAAVDRAIAADVVLVAAADNKDTDADGNPTEDQGIPASYLQPVGSGPHIDRGSGLVVTAAQYDGRRAWFGPGRGTGISLAGYGAAGPENRGIFSTFPAGVTEIETMELCGVCRGSFEGDDRFAYLEGTSMATPQVAGAAALIRHRKPKMPASQVISLLKRKATRAGGYSDELGWGILNANRALRAALAKKRK
jgi:serine protease